MNILVNAIDAIEDAIADSSFAEIHENPNRIAIRTISGSGQVKIAIADSAVGKPPEVKAHIFNHLFTTKAVGQGTGVRLSIARQIVKENMAANLKFDRNSLETATSAYPYPANLITLRRALV